MVHLTRALFPMYAHGCHRSTHSYSLVKVSRFNGQERYAWLRHVLERLPHAQPIGDDEALPELLVRDDTVRDRFIWRSVALVDRLRCRNQGAVAKTRL